MMSDTTDRSQRAPIDASRYTPMSGPRHSVKAALQARTTRDTTAVAPPPSASIREDVLSMFDGGVAPAQIADALKIPLPSVNAIILRTDRRAAILQAAIDAKPALCTSDRETRNAVIAMYRNQVPVIETTKRLGISRDEYWAIIAEEGVPVRSWRRRDEMARARRNVELLAMYEDRVPVAHICEMLGVSRRYFYNILEGLNVQTHWGPTREGPSKTPLEVLTDAGFPRPQAEEITRHAFIDINKPSNDSGASSA